MSERHYTTAEIAEWCAAHPDRLKKPRKLPKAIQALEDAGAVVIESQGVANRRRIKRKRKLDYRRGAA